MDASGRLFPTYVQVDDCAILARRALELIRDIYPICRSITGAGVRETLARVARLIQLDISEVPSGTPVLDWEIPREWNIHDAYVADSSGRRVIDFRAHNLHVLNYSTPVRAKLPLAELREHLYTLPQQPDRIPYRTSYWQEDWGFCLTQAALDAMPEGQYDVVIDAELKPGSLTYGECLVRGESSEEFLISTHVCHPSLANDNCSGIALAALLAEQLGRGKPRLSYRILFVPGTIGSIAWLARNRDRLHGLRGGLVIGLLGDPGPLTYKRSRRGSCEVDRIAAEVVRELDVAARLLDFSPYGYDERQFCSPGFDLPVGRLTRSANDMYPEYHTSADDLELIRADALAQSMLALLRIVERVDSNRRYCNRHPFGEPRLGRRGLFRATGGANPGEFEHALLWVLNQSDGGRGILDIAAAAGMPQAVVQQAADALVAAGLLEEVVAEAGPCERRNARAVGDGVRRNPGGSQ
jgi:aminopeptidase-like protein